MADQDVQPVKPNRIWRIVLVLSLALNLAVVGVVAGSLVSGNFAEGPPRSFDLGLGPVSRALSPDERRDIGRSLRRDGGLRNVDLRGRMTGMVEALKAEPFDEVSLRSLMAEQSARASEVQTKAQDALVEMISQMSLERRAAFADKLQEEMSRSRSERGGSSGG